MAPLEPDDILARLVAIDTVCQDLSSRDKLELLAEAYLIAADRVRTDALITPGGFQAEQESQVAMLDEMAALIRADTPDLELQRLVLENDTVGILRYLEQRRNELDRNRPPGT